MTGARPPTTTVDARGLRCPRPVIELSRAIADAHAEIVVLIADDPNARVDVPVWCRLKRHVLVGTATHGDAWHFTVRVTPPVERSRPVEPESPTPGGRT